MPSCQNWISLFLRGVPGLLLLLLLLLARPGGSSPASGAAAAFSIENQSSQPPPPVIHEGAEDDNDPCSTESYDALACFLFRVSLVLPSQSFREGILKLTLDDLTCSHFAVSGLIASWSSASNNETDTAAHLDIRIDRMAAVCTAKYQVTAGVSGSLTATVGPPQQQQHQHQQQQQQQWSSDQEAPTDRSSFDDAQPALLWSLNIPSSTANAAHLIMPEQVQTAECQTSLGVIALTFSGSISSHVVELFHTPIANYVTSQINQQVCPNLVSQIDPLISNALHQLESSLDPFLLPHNSTMHNDDDNGYRSATPATPSIETTTFLAETDVASSSSSFQSPDDEDWIDFGRDAPALTNLLQIANRYARDYLHGGLLRHAFPHTPVVPPLHHCGAGFDGWNGILTTLTTNDGQLDLPLLAALEPIQFDLPGISTHVDVWLERARLAGINDWDRFQVLDPLPPHDFATHLTFGGGSNEDEDDKDEAPQPPLQLLLDLRINASSYLSTPPSVGDGTGLVERVQVMVNVSSLDVGAQFQVGFRETDWNALPLQTVIDAIRGIVDPTFDNVPAVQCLLHGVDVLRATSLSAMLQLSGASIVPLPLPGRRRWRRQLLLNTPGVPDDGLECEVDQLINTVADLVLTSYQPYITAALQGLAQGPLPQVVNDALQHWLDSLRPPPPQLPRRGAILHPAARAAASAAASASATGHNATCSVPTPQFPDWVNFSTVAPLNELNRRLQLPTTLDTINAYLECVVGFLTRALREQLQAWFDPGNGTTVDAAVKVDVRELEIVHVGNLQNAHLAQPERDGRYLSNGLSYGTSYGSAADSPRPELLVGLDLSYPPLNATISFNATLSVDDIELGLGTILHYDWNGLQQLALQQLARHGLCAAAPASDWTWIDTVGRLGYFAVTLNGSAQVGSMNRPVVLSIDSKNHPSIDDAAEAVFLWVADSTHDLANAWTDAVRARANQECGWDGGSDGQENDDSDRATLTSILVIMAAILLLAQPSVILIQHAPQRSRDFPEDRQLARPLLRGQHLPSHEMYDDDPGFMEVEEIETQDDPKKPLMDCQSHLIACAFAVAVVVTMVLLLASHLSVLATVDYSLVFGGRDMPVASVVEINPHRSAHVGLNPLIVVVGLFSGLWPSLRLSLMLYVWVTSALSSNLRHRVVVFLDALGKLAFFEVYVMCLAMVIFHYHLQVDEQHLLDVYLTPKFGLYGFWLGTSVSVVLGHFLVYCHRRPEWARLRAASRRPSSLWNQQRSVLTHSFGVGGNSNGGGGHRQLSLLCYAALLLWLLAAVLFLGLGVSRHIFAVDLDGVASLPLVESEKHVEYSLLSLGARLPDAAGSRSWSLGIAGLTAFFFATVLVLPLVALVALALLLVWPMTTEQQLQLLSWSEVARAWSAVEVAAVSVVVAVGQFPHLVQRAMEESQCIWMLRELVVADGNSGAELPSTCYSLHVSWRGAVAYLAVGVLLQGLWVGLVLELARQAVWERLYPDDDGTGRQPFRSGFVLRRLAQHRCLQWMWAPPHDLYFFGGSVGEDGRDDSAGSSGPPLQGGGGTTTAAASSSTAPWQVNGSFEDEWQEAAERDPEWKEWKDATNVT